MMIAGNVLQSARQAGVQKLLFLGSSCIYPRLAAQPIREDALLTGPLEPSNQWYAIAKITGIMLCEAYRKQYGCDFISAMPTNLYGPHDNFDLLSSHVLPALLVKHHQAKQANLPRVVVWGTGAALREFLHVDDLADALVFLLKTYSGEEHVNVGYGTDISIHELALQVAKTVGFSGDLVFDTSKPDGTPRKLLDSSKIRAMGWAPKVGLVEGLQQTYDWFVAHVAKHQERD
jgi:GDP-L-fucose synthase